MKVCEKTQQKPLGLKFQPNQLTPAIEQVDFHFY